MDTQEKLLEMKHITKIFPGVVALHDVPFTLRRGEIHALLGENGAGKSTLIKVLTGVFERDEGDIFLEGRAVSPQSPQAAQNIGISTVYQEVNLCPNLSVAENVYIGREPGSAGRIDWKTINRKADELLGRFDLHIDVTQTLDRYSVAVQQMVAIARAVDISAKVLILDEPTSSLTAVEVRKLFEIMRMLKERGMGIIFVTHFLDQVYEVSDTITVLRGGEYMGSSPTADLPKMQLVARMIGKEYEDLEGRPAPTAADRARKDLFLRLEKAASARISDVNIDLHKGEVLGFSGLLGSGRSEIARMIFGVDPLVEGGVEIGGRKAAVKEPIAAMRAGIGFCPENRKSEGIVGDLSVRENIMLALQAKQGAMRAMSRRQSEKLADTYIEQLSIKTPTREQAIHNLSGGNQQKVILARWLATNPDLLMLDEPTRGIDIGTKAEIQKLVIKLAKEGMSLVFISSEVDEMVRCCGRMVVLRDKKLVGELAGEEISEDMIVKYMAGGEQLEPNTETVR
ncbi:MAG: sugar ABC transporter ATP-binding protein [Oscillospiraceae bacterium]|jgi:simple sugar transport system ATP-binding protein|nr:sugar ABC transporter ATP-binding protein [Oscillospiraceae bacterium]